LDQPAPVVDGPGIRDQVAPGLDAAGNVVDPAGAAASAAAQDLQVTDAVHVAIQVGQASGVQRQQVGRGDEAFAVVTRGVGGAKVAPVGDRAGIDQDLAADDVAGVGQRAGSDQHQVASDAGPVPVVHAAGLDIDNGITRRVAGVDDSL